MPKTSVMQTNFTAGELSPLLDGQVDLKQYFNGGHEVTNFVPIPQGPLMRRTGTQYIADGMQHAEFPQSYNSRLLPFQFSTAQSYVLEFACEPSATDRGFIRFYTDRGQIYSGGAPYQINHPYDSDALAELQYAQTADVLIIVHPRYAPRQLKRLGSTNWVLEVITFTNPPKIDDTHYYWTEENGYPSTVCFYQQRLVFGGSLNYPQTVWFSVVGIYYDFTVSAVSVSTDAITYTISSDQLNKIQWMISQKVIVLGTTGDEFIIYASDSSEGITPSTVKATRQTAYGSASLGAHLLEKSVVFIQNGRRKVRNVVYDYVSDTYDAEDLTTFAEHITESSIHHTAVMSNPDTILWACLSNGVLIGCTLDKDQKVVGWHKHLISGKGPWTSDIVIVEDVCVIPGQNGDELWIIVQRIVNGAFVKQIEVLVDFGRSPVGEPDRTYLDSYQRGIFSPPQTVITGLSHLEGETVLAVCDGWVHPPLTVTGGQVTLRSAASDVRIGLQFSSRFQSMRIAPATADTLTFHLPKRLTRLWLSVYKSLAPYVGVKTTLGPESDEYDWTLLPTLIGAPRVMDMAQKPVTDDIQVSLGVNSTTRPRLVIEAQEPLPLNLLSYVVEVETSSL